MFRIIKADLYRLFNETYLKVMVLISFLYPIIRAIPFYEMLEKTLNVDLEYEPVVVYGYSAFEQLNFDGFFTFFVPFLIVIIFSSEFAKKTIRNIAALKIKRESIFLGKYIVFVLLVLMLMSVSAINATVLYTILNGWGNSIFAIGIIKVVSLVIRYTIIQIAYASVLILLALFVQNGALMFVLYFSLSLMESIIASMTQMLGKKINVFKIISYVFPTTYMYEFPQMVLSDDKFAGAIISLALYIILTMILGCVIMKRKDIRC